jgi:hypothetical protein
MCKIAKLTLLLIGICLAGSMTLATSYAFWAVSSTQESVTPNDYTVGCFSVTFSDNSSQFTLSSKYPISDTRGQALTNPYTFTITNVCGTSSVPSKTNILIVPVALTGTDAARPLSDTYIKYYYEATKTGDATPTTGIGYLNNLTKDSSGNYQLLSNVQLASGESVSYTLRMWVPLMLENGTEVGNEAQNKIFKATVRTYSVPNESVG